MLNHIGIGSVGIELHEESEIFYLLAELREISMNSRLSSADDDSFQKSDTRGEESEKYLLGNEVMTNLLDLSREHELGIVAKSATQIASRCEDYGCNFAWIV